ncbi:MAG TPA: 3-deoxy-D-manno-octulosonic acid transferase [Edaphobacter sp.]|nr:3-deoxy-D-manno-octulosonic acid transferase [Edaphobacter sp.]
MILAVYSALLALVLVAGAPWWLFRMATSGRYRAGLGGRLGRIPHGLAGAVAGRRVIWLHAVSVGEVMAATELVRSLRKALPEWVIAVSTTTETGQRLARERFGPESPVFYLPLDFATLVRRYLRVLHPELLVLMESEFWPNLMDGCAEQGIPVAVVNTRVSDRSLPRYLRLRSLWKPLLERVSLFLAQSEENARRLARIGAPRERVHVSGNLKYDVKTAGANAMTALLRERIPAAAKIVVAGSTGEGEERILLEAWKQVLESEPEAVLILAPRRVERFGAVAALVEAAGFDVARASALAAGEAGMGQEGVILLDTIGDLASVYSLGTIAFVGGSLVTGGGHNPLEPAQFGVPVVMGRSTENFREIVDAMLKAEAIRIVDSTELAGAVTDLLANADKAHRMGEQGRMVFIEQAGATKRTVEALLELLNRGES